VCLLAGVASKRIAWLLPAFTIGGLGLYASSVGPFLIWAASCADCGASFEGDIGRSHQAMLIHVWWGGLLATAVAATWIGAWAEKRFL
jgi:hypothetical protein